jgi:hypothetical protein
MQSPSRSLGWGFVLLEIAPLLLVSRAPMGRLDLEPIPAIARAVGSCAALRYDTLKLQAFGSREEIHAIIEAFD